MVFVVSVGGLRRGGILAEVYVETLVPVVLAVAVVPKKAEGELVGRS